MATDGPKCFAHDQYLPCLACRESGVTGIDYRTIKLNDLKYSLLRMLDIQAAGEPLSKEDADCPLSEFVQHICVNGEHRPVFLSAVAMKLARLIEKELK